MGFFDSYQWKAPPGLGDLISFGQQWANTDFRSPYEQAAQKFLNHLYGGNLTKQQKAMNSPFITNYTNAYDVAADSGMRDADRNYAMSTAMLPAGQQALRAAQQGVMDTKAADQKGIGHMNAFSQAINAATGTADTGLNRNMQGNEFGADLWSNALNKYQMVKKPGLLSQIGQIAGVAGQIGMDALTAGSMGAPWGGLPGTGCWIAMALYGDDDPRVATLRRYIFGTWPRRSWIGQAFARAYLRFGQRIARVVKRNKGVRVMFKVLFDCLLADAERAEGVSRKGSGEVKGRESEIGDLRLFEI